jgi:hypothetical protein
MPGKSRRCLLKSAITGTVSLIGAKAALAFPTTEESEENAERGASSLTGTPGGPTTSIQYNADGGNFGGIANFEMSSAGVVKIGPAEREIPPLTTAVPRLQLATGSLAKIETNTIGTMAAVAFVDNSSTASNATYSEDGFSISRNYMPSAKVASNFSFNGMEIGISNDPSNTQDQSGLYFTGLGVFSGLFSPTTIGNASAIEIINFSVVSPGQTQTVESVIGLYTETLLGDGANVATYNVTKAVGLNIGTTGFYGPQAGVIGTSWGLNIEGPRLGAGTGSVAARVGIRMASQSQGNPEGRNPNSWAICEEDPTDRNAMGSINLRGAGGPLISAGTGDPNGVVTSVVGGLYLRVDGGAGSSLYVKESGAGNTGWVAK